MIPWETLDVAEPPGGGEPLRLMRRGAELSIMVGANELMNSRLGASEAALATRACALIAGVAAPRVLIGGLGMGFTLRAALEGLGAQARVTVAELAPQVAAWARGPMAGLFAGALDDARTRVRIVDVAEAIGAAPQAWDAILLDVDNGPGGLVAAANDGLYAARGLAAAWAALAPGGVLGVWSAAPDAAFARRLAQAGFAVRQETARAHRGGGARHVIWLAVRPRP